MCPQILVNVLDIKCHEHPFGGKCVLPNGLTDRHNAANGRSLQFVFQQA
jgi:hypothetical protein